MQKPSWRTAFIIGCCIFVLDFITKLIAATAFPLPDVIGGADTSSPFVVFENFFGIELSFTHTVNSGAAWGIFADFPKVLVMLRLILIIVLIYYLIIVNKRKSWRIPLVLIISGAIGNVIDNFLYGYVIDMIHFRFWGYDYPVFNIADSSIFIGSIWIMSSVLFESKKTKS
jgi:signal peptidase II